MSELLYQYKNQGKTSVSFMFLIAAIGMVFLGSAFGAPIYWYTPIGFVLLFVSWHFMSNPNHGCRLTSEVLEVWANKDIKRFGLKDIERVEVNEWMDGPTDFTLHFQSGSTETLPHLSIGESAGFRRALEASPLKVVDQQKA